ncbi:MAG TPA: hypothetical protein DC063_02105 [Arenimonas sp.]|nr:MAG: hypothetical protein A2X76_13030 [Xanthomonadales bacterium GWF1_69_6]HBD18997.1 hypothetical protein [Arenimonas sp.]
MAAKKLLTGCLVVLLLAVIAAGLAWQFVLRPMWQAGGGLVEGAREWASAVDLGDDIVNQAAFDAPSDGKLTSAQVDAFVRVQSVVAREMGGDLALMGRRAQAAAAERASGAAEPSLQDVGRAYQELSGLLSRWRIAQAAGVNEVGLSREEYAWVRRQALAALPLLVELPATPALPGLPSMAAPDPLDEQAMAAARHNAALLRPHLPLLEKTLGALPLAP